MQSKEDSKRSLMSSIVMSLIQQNKAPDEVNAFLSMTCDV